MDDIIARIDALLANTPQSEIEEFEVTRCLRDAKDELIAARACAEMMLQGTGQPIAERMAERVLSDIASTFAGVPQWIPVSERLPPAQESEWEDSVAVLAWRKGHGIDTACFIRDKDYGDRWGWECVGDPTHWMPLPEPPTE